MADNQDILSFLSRDEEIFLGERILDLAESVRNKDSREVTSFLNPREQEIAGNILHQLADVNFLSEGGHPRAERKRFLIFPDYLFPGHQEVPLNCLKIEGNFEFVNVEHGDFLGAIMALGIKRKMLGDIFLYGNTAQVIIAPEIAEEIQFHLGRVGEVPVEVEPMDCKDIIFEEKHRKQIEATVASLRLDAVISAGFGEARSRSKAAVEAGKIKLNWREEMDPAAEVEVEDIISFRGRGRLKIAEKRGISNSGRIKLLLERIT